MQDAYDTNRDRLDELRQQFGYVAGASGLAVALGSRVVSFDLFDKVDTCRKVWDRLLSGTLLECLTAVHEDQPAKLSDVESLVRGLAAAQWEPAVPAGEGQEFRGVMNQGTQASALYFDERLVHGSAVAAETI